MTSRLHRGSARKRSSASPGRARRDAAACMATPSSPRQENNAKHSGGVLSLLFIHPWGLALDLPPRRATASSHDLYVPSLSHLRLQEPTRPEPRESSVAAAGRGSSSLGETTTAFERGLGFLGAPVSDLEGLAAGARHRETGDGHPLAPLRFQTILDMEEPETWPGPSRHRSRHTHLDPNDVRS